MKPVLVGTVITVIVSAGFAIAARWIHPYVDTSSFVMGEAYLFLSLAVTMLAAQVYYALRRHGWTAQVSDWLSRVEVGVTHDWHTDEHGCFFFDLFKIFGGRSHELGTFQAELFILGLGARIGILIDRAEHDAHTARLKVRRDQAHERMRQEIVNLIKRVVPAGVMVRADDDSSVH